MKKKFARSLSVHRETLRKLVGSELTQPNGGMPPTEFQTEAWDCRTAIKNGCGETWAPPCPANITMYTCLC